MLVSIHAPVWGATGKQRFENIYSNVSIHAPVWGATPRIDTEKCSQRSFNPRARGGRDQKLMRIVAISSGFQSTRPCGGRDVCQFVIAFHCFKFQSTRPCGARPTRTLLFCAISFCFNPRARVGRDYYNRKWKITVTGFNPRARVGRDRWMARDGAKIREFQSTRPCGARQQCSFIHHGRKTVSIHAPVWGATWSP